MLANVGSASVIGVTGTAVGVEVHVSNGLPGLTVVGLPDTACREARDRVRAALLSSRLKYPDARITVNLAPSGVRKAGAGLDLAIAVGVLAASSQLPPESVADTSFLGELGLDGTLRPVPGIVPMLAAMPTRNVVVPAASLPEALVVTSGAHGVHTLTELVEALHGRAPWPDVEPAPRAPEPVDAVDLAEVRGHPWARRALEVAAAGGHHLLMVGPPGAGKTMLAERLPGLLPDLGPRLSLEVTCVHSAAGLPLGQSGLITRAPLRRPHHSASAVSLIGGGSHHLRPGEVSLAHGSVRLTPMTSCVIYCRISRDPRGDLLGVQRQERECREYAAKAGWTVAEMFVDDDRSAYSGKPRPGYTALLDALKAGSVDVVVAWAPDRFTRSTRELEDFIDAVESGGAEVATVKAGRYDLSTPSGRMSARVVGSVARFESEHKSERLRAKAAELARAGKVGGGGTRPFGFEADRITVVESEAKVIRECADRVLAGWSLRSIAADLIRRKVPTVTGRPWTTIVLKRMMTSPRIAGLREHRGEVVGKAVWTSILDETTWHSLRAVLLDPARNSKRGGAPRRYLLSGIARCDLCDAKLVARPRGDGRRCYVCARGPGCSGCGKIRVLADAIEDEVVARLLVRLEGADLPSPPAPAAWDEMPDEDVAALEQRLDDLAGEFASGAVSAAMFKRTAARVESALADARSRQTSVVNHAVDTGLLDMMEPVSGWAMLNIDQRRRVLSTLMDRVGVGSAVRGRNTFDPERVSVSWRV